MSPASQLSALSISTEVWRPTLTGLLSSSRRPERVIETDRRIAAVAHEPAVMQALVPFGAHAAGWALPLQAVARQDDQAYVFVRTEKGFVARPVTVVSSAGPSVQVTGDLKPGQEVAASSVIALKAAWQGKSGGDK